MKVILSPQADIDMDNIPARWTGHIDFALDLLRSAPIPTGLCDWLEPEGLVDVGPVNDFSRVPPKVYRLKFVDPKTRKAVVPYRIIYCLDRPRDTVYVMTIPDRSNDPYEIRNVGQIQALLLDYRRHRGKGGTQRAL